MGGTGNGNALDEPMEYDLSKLPSDNKGPTLFAAQLGLTIFSFVVILIRLYVRCILVKVPGRDDLFICIGWLCLCVVTTLMCIGCANLGLGKHVWYLTVQNMLDWQRVQMQVIWLHQWALVFTRISILTFYLRLSTLKTFRNIVFSVIGLNAGWAVVTLIVSVNVCSPPRKLWEPETPGTCFHGVPWYIATAVINITLDVLVYTTPLPMLKALQINFKQKLGLYATFGLGFFACISSIMRVPALAKILKTTDYMYDEYDICLWSTIELNVGIFCACIPTFKALLRHLPGRNTVAGSSMGYSKTGGASKFNRSTANQSVVGNETHTGTGLNSYSLSYVQRRDNESEEHIVVPQGKIMAKTDINVYTEERIGDEEQGEFKKSSPTESLRSSNR